MLASRSPTRALSLPPCRRAGRPQKASAAALFPHPAPSRVAAAAPRGCGGRRAPLRAPAPSRGAARGAPQRAAGRDSAPASPPPVPAASPRRAPALRRIPPPHLPRRPRSPTWPPAAAPRLPSARRSPLPPKHGPATEPSPGEAPPLPPVPTPPRLPAGGAAAARPRRWQGAARPLPAAGPAAAERGALWLGGDERSAVADRFPRTTDCGVTVTAPQCFIGLWSGLFLDPCPSEAPIPLIS